MQNYKKVFLKYRFTIIVGLFIVVLIIIGQSNYKKPVEVFDKGPLAFYNNKTNIQEIASTDQEGQELTNNLIIKPGLYKIFGQSYDLQQEGLYRFILPGSGNEQRIVYEHDVSSVISAIAWIFSHGNLDNGKKVQQLEKKALTEKLITTCGEISNFTQSILKEKNIDSRIVSGLTAEERNGYDDSHVMIEVKEGEKWKLYDLDNNAMFIKDGQYLNYLGFQELVATGSYEIEKLALDTKTAILGFKDKKTGYDYSFYSEERFFSDESLKNWYKRVLQIPFVKEGNMYYYYEGDEKEVQSFMQNSRKLNKDEFIKKFY